MRERAHQTYVLLVAVAVILPVIGFALGLVRQHEFYEAYPDDRSIDAGLARAEAGFVSAMSRGDEPTVLFTYADRSSMARMLHLYLGYSGRPTSRSHAGPADDGLGVQTITVTCSPGDVQRLDLVWGWSDGSWRASPTYQLLRHDRVREYPGCPGS